MPKYTWVILFIHVLIKSPLCLQEKRKIKTSSKAAENMEKASDVEKITRPEPSKDETGDAKRSKTPKAGKIKSSTITDKISGETKINTEAIKLRSKEQNKKSETGVKKSVISQKYDPVRAKAKVISKKAKEHGQKLLKQNSKMDKSGSSQQNQGTNQLRRSLREAKITNFKDLFRDAYKNTEESEKVVAKKNDMVGQKDKSLTNIDSMAIKTKIIPHPPIIYPNIKFKDPKSEVKGLKTQLSKKKLAQQKIQKKLTQLNEKPQTQWEEKRPLRRKRRKCGSCGPCERADDCGQCRFCLVSLNDIHYENMHVMNNKNENFHLKKKKRRRINIFIAPAYSKERYRSSNFCPSVRSFVRPSATFTSKFGFLDIRDSCETETLHTNSPWHTLQARTLTWCP